MFFYLAYVYGASLSSCSTTQQESRLNAQKQIAYPFYNASKRLGEDPESKRFIIKSAIGQAEYTVEIPDAGNGYDIQIPLASLNPPTTSEALAIGAKNGKVPSPVSTDKELVNSLPSISKTHGEDLSILDAAMGVGSPEGPIQAPSYTLGLARANQYFRDRNYDLALMEVNNLIAFYPNSPKLLKMKGTLLLKTGNQELAAKAWQKANRLAPSDKALASAVKRLETRILATKGPNSKPDSPSSLQPNESGSVKPNTSLPAH
ncbi:MAG: hypothetical protein NT027_06340 [Proteobacteria bacterium]|nr:hypothetical protein [Pseudomonadota bacterium]